jgi:hypothetical protein
MAEPGVKRCRSAGKRVLWTRFRRIEDAERVVVVVPRVPQRGGSGVAGPQPRLLPVEAVKHEPRPCVQCGQPFVPATFRHAALLGPVPVALGAAPEESGGVTVRLGKRQRKPADQQAS